MRKKILQISPYTFDHPGWVEQYAKTLQEIFPEDIYTLSGWGEFAIVEPVLHCPLPCFWRKGFWKNLNKISKENTKYIISHIRFAPTSWFAFFLAKTRWIPYIHIEHGTGFLIHKNIVIAWVAKLVDLIIGRYIIRHATYVICVSEAGKKWVSKTFGRNNIEVIYRGFSFPTVERKKNKIPKIGFVGRLTGLKNVSLLIEALSEIQNQSWTLEIVWDGEERKSLERLSHERWIQDRITFLGTKSHEWVINEFYPTVDIFINPSLQEWLPTTVIEALGMGCTVIATDVGGTGEIEWVNLIPRNNPIVLEKIIMKYLYISTEEIALNEQFSLEKMRQEYTKLFMK